MIVQDLIDELNKIKDKSVDVKVMLMDGNEIDLDSVEMFEDEDEDQVFKYVRLS